MKSLIIIIILFFSPFIIKAQEGELKFDDVKVIKEFNADIGDFNKVNIDPVLPVYDIKSRKYEYKIRSIPAKMEYDKPKIRPLALKPEPAKEFNKYFVKLGYGSQGLLGVDAGANFKYKEVNAGIGVHHISANNDKDIKFQNISDSKVIIVIHGLNEAKKQAFEVNTDIDNSYIYLYSNLPVDSISATNTKRRYLSAQISGSFKKDELFTNVKNKTDVKFRSFQFNAKDVSENSLFVKNVAEYQLSRNNYIDIPLELEYILVSGKYVLQLKPNFIYSSRPLNLKAGIQMGLSGDKNLLSPYLELSTNLWHNFIELYAAYDSKFYLNSDFVKTGINPFYSFNETEIRSSKFTNIITGLRNSLEGAKIEVKITYQKFDDHLFFKGDTQDPRTFSAVYDDGTNVKIEAKASYKPLKKWEIGGSITKNFYKLANFDKPWYTPDLYANVFSKATILSDRLIIGGELYLSSASWYQDATGNNKKLDPLLDLNANVKFLIVKNSACFISINNIFAQKYQQWYNYPGFGMNIMAGVELRF